MCGTDASEGGTQAFVFNQAGDRNLTSTPFFTVYGGQVQFLIKYDSLDAVCPGASQLATFPDVRNENRTSLNPIPRCAIAFVRAACDSLWWHVGRRRSPSVLEQRRPLLGAHRLLPSEVRIGLRLLPGTELICGLRVIVFVAQRARLAQHHSRPAPCGPRAQHSAPLLPARRGLPAGECALLSYGCCGGCCGAAVFHADRTFAPVMLRFRFPRLLIRLP